MELNLEDTTAQLSRLVRTDLQGAELVEFRQVADDADENAYIVRWTRATPAAGDFREYGTHHACLGADGRAMLVWGHYTRNRREAESDYKERRR